MRIAINTRLLLREKLEGIGWFTMETTRRLVQNHPEHEFIFIFDRPFAEEFIFSDNITPLVIGPPARHPFLFLLWFEYRIPKILKKYKVDIFLSPDGYLSLNTNIPQLAVIHDISFRYRPEDLPRLAGWYYNYFFPRFAKNATRIATVSTYSKNDIAEAFDVPLSKIDVIYNGIKGDHSIATNSEKTLTKEKYSGGREYFLYVGALQPRKNIPGLLLAYEKFRKSISSNIKLMIVGGEMHKTADIYNVLKNMKYNSDVIFTGRVNEKELKNIYSAAFALTYVPFFEGFGMPIAEAMSAGIPVICSNTTSMPEVGGDAAVFIDPNNINQIADAMSRIASDSALRNDLIQKGFIQKEKFSWEKTSEALWESLQKAVSSASKIT